MKEEKIVIEGLEINAKYINSGKFKLIHVINGTIYQYVSLSDSCSFGISRCEVDSYYTLSLTKVRTFDTDNTYYLIDKSEADKIIRYFGLTGKQETIRTTGFLQVDDFEPIESKTTIGLNEETKANKRDAKKRKIIPLTVD